MLPEWARDPTEREDVVELELTTSHDEETQCDKFPSWYYGEEDKKEQCDADEGNLSVPSAERTLVSINEDLEQRALVVGLVLGRVIWRDGNSYEGLIQDCWFFICQVSLPPLLS